MGGGLLTGRHPLLFARPGRSSTGEVVRNLSLGGPWLWLAGLAAWGSITVWWSADWRTGLDALVHGAALLSVALAVSFLPARALEWLPHAAALSIMGVLAIWLTEGEYGGFGNRNFATEYVMMAAPFAWLAPKWIKRCSLSAGTLVLMMNQGALKWVALLILLYFVARPAGKRGDYGVAACGVLGVLFIAWVVQGGLPYSVLARLEFFINGLSLVAQAPALGHGLGSLNAVYPEVAENHVWLLGQRTALLGTDHYVGALHNEFLQWTVETGLVGLSLLGGLCAGLARRFRHAGRTDRLDKAGGYVLVVGGVLACIGFPLQNPATGFIAAVALGLLCGKGRVFWPVACLASGSFIVAAVLTTSASLYFGWAVANRGNPEAALKANVQAWRDYPLWSEPRRQMAPLVAAWARFHRPNPVLADQAFDIARTASGSDPGLLVARIEYLLNSGRGGPEIRSALDLLMNRHALQPQTKALRALLWSEEWLFGTALSTRPPPPSM